MLVTGEGFSLTFGHQVSFVGQIRKVSTGTTNVTYEVDDGTGIIEVKRWIDPDAVSLALVESFGRLSSKVAENEYIRVWGRPKAWNGRRHVGASAIRRIFDKNEISYHLLEAAAVHLYFTRGPREHFGDKKDKLEGQTGRIR